MKRLLSRLSNLIKIGKKESGDDSGNLRFARVLFLGKPNSQKSNEFTPYGLMSNAPNGSMVLLFANQGQESSLVGIADDPKNRPLKNLKIGEAALGNYLTGDYIYFKENGDLQIKTSGNLSAVVNGTASIESIGSMTLKAPQINLDTPLLSMSSASGGVATMKGNISMVDGDFTTNQNITAAGIDLSTHVHSGVQSGGSNTGPPV